MSNNETKEITALGNMLGLNVSTRDLKDEIMRSQAHAQVNCLNKVRFTLNIYNNIHRDQQLQMQKYQQINDQIKKNLAKKEIRFASHTRPKPKNRETNISTKQKDQLVFKEQNSNYQKYLMKVKLEEMSGKIEHSDMGGSVTNTERDLQPREKFGVTETNFNLTPIGSLEE